MHRRLVVLNFPGLEPGELENSCALDIADEGGDESIQALASKVGMHRGTVWTTQQNGLAKLIRKNAVKVMFEEAGLGSHPR